MAVRPFGRLIRLEQDATLGAPRVLLVAPLSGMRAALLWDMMLGLAAEHDAHLLAWNDAADVPAALGRFGLEDNVAYVLDAVRRLGPGAHLIGLCQSALPALAAASLLAAGGDPSMPATLTLIGGKLDTRISPTRVDRLTRSLPLAWFERQVIGTVPAGRRGEGRRVYPASVERALLLAYLFRHLAGGGELLGKLLMDDGEDPLGHPFIAHLLEADDLPAEFFLDVVAQVFHDAALAEGRLAWRGVPVDPAAVAGTALLTVEGEADDVSAPGQTRVAHRLCARVPDGRRRHLSCPGTGHFGLFHGAVWRGRVLPTFRGFAREMA